MTHAAALLPVDVRQLELAHADAAAAIHHAALAVMPGCDPTLHTSAECHTYWREEVFQLGPVWGAFANGQLVGVLATSPGWIDHLHVAPDCHRRGVGSRLVSHAQSLQEQWRLFTFLVNTPARRLYEAHGFAMESETDGARNEERLPDITYIWQRSGQ